MDEKMKCRIGRMRFALSDQPDPGPRLAEACLGLNEKGRCNCWVFPDRVGAARLALSEEDVAINSGDQADFDSLAKAINKAGYDPAKAYFLESSEFATRSIALATEN